MTDGVVFEAGAIHLPPPVYGSLSRVGRSKIYNSMKLIENGEASRARALEHPIMRRTLYLESGQ